MKNWASLLQDEAKERKIWVRLKMKPQKADVGAFCQSVSLLTCTYEYELSACSLFI
jgi:hypothetical protein